MCFVAIMLMVMCRLGSFLTACREIRAVSLPASRKETHASSPSTAYQPLPCGGHNFI